MLLTSMDTKKFYTMYLSNLRITGTKRIRICSPFRRERSASFEINMENGLWYDFGSGEGGDVIDFICRIEGIEIGEALRRYELVMNGEIRVRSRKIEGVVQQVANDSTDSMRIFRREYLDGVHRWDESILGGRGITESVFRKYNGWMWREGESANVLIGYGSSGEIVDHYKMWTWRRGKKYILSRGGVTLYPVANLRYRDIVLCEGEFDCLSVCSAGYHGVTGTGGSSTFKEEWVWALSKKRICVMYDNDDPGIAGALQVESMMKKWAKSVYVHQWEDKPLHYDVGDYINNGGLLNERINFA